MSANTERRIEALRVIYHAPTPRLDWERLTPWERGRYRTLAARAEAEGMRSLTDAEIEGGAALAELLLGRTERGAS